MRNRRILAALSLAVVAIAFSPSIANAVESGGEGGGGGEEEISHAAEECIEILEGGGEPDNCLEAPNPILPATNELIWGAASFIVLLLALNKFAFPALKQAMADRSDKIRDSLDEAEQAKSEAAAVLADYQRQLADAKAESGRIIDEARQSADGVKRDLMAKAESEATEARRRNAEQIGAERDRVMSELQGQVAVLAVDMAERVVESSLDRDASMRLIENYISTVGAGGSPGTSG